MSQLLNLLAGIAPWVIGILTIAFAICFLGALAICVYVLIKLLKG